MNTKIFDPFEKPNRPRKIRVLKDTVLCDPPSDFHETWCNFRQACGGDYPDFDDKKMREFEQIIADDIALNLAYHLSFPRTGEIPEIVMEPPAHSTLPQLMDAAIMKFQELPERYTDYGHIFYEAFRVIYNKLRGYDTPWPSAHTLPEGFFYVIPCRKPFDRANFDIVLCPAKDGGREIHFFGDVESSGYDDYWESRAHNIMMRGENLDTKMPPPNGPFDFQFHHVDMLPDGVRGEDLPDLCKKENAISLNLAPKFSPMKAKMHYELDGRDDYFPVRKKNKTPETVRPDHPFPAYAKLHNDRSESSQIILEASIKAANETGVCRSAKLFPGFYKSTFRNAVISILREHNNIRRPADARYETVPKLRLDGVETTESESGDTKERLTADRVVIERYYTEVLPSDMRKAMEEDPRLLIILENFRKDTAQIHKILHENGFDHSKRTTQRLWKKVDTMLDKEQDEREFWELFFYSEVWKRSKERRKHFRVGCVPKYNTKSRTIPKNIVAKENTIKTLQ